MEVVRADRQTNVGKMAYAHLKKQMDTRIRIAIRLSEISDSDARKSTSTDIAYLLLL